MRPISFALCRGPSRPFALITHTRCGDYKAGPSHVLPIHGRRRDPEGIARCGRLQ